MTAASVPDARDRRIVFRYFLRSLLFGTVMGVVFPLYANFFVSFKSETDRWIFVGGCVAAGLLVGIFSFLIGKATVLAAVDQVRQRLVELGENGRGLEGGIELSSSDGIGKLADAFNGLLGKLRDMLDSLARVADGTEEVGFELAANATETSAASEQISRHMDMVHEQTEVLLGEIDRVNQAGEAIRGSASLVSDNINRQSDSLTKLSSSIEIIVGDFKALSAATNERTLAIASSIAESGQSLGIIEQNTRRIKDIAESVERIAAWAAAINDIAGTISLLGMNASIEAAHAGAAGRGFAVVAGEIQKLSVQVGQKSAEIDRGLKEVITRVRDGVSFAEANQGGLASLFGRITESTEAIGSVSRRFAEIAAKADSMLEAHNELVKVTIDVTDSTVSMRDRTNDIEDSVGILLGTSEAYKAAIDEVSLGIREIAIDVAHLNKVSEANAENTKTLKAEIAKFGM
jgi:Methyl-accepting chemotaxis protein